MARRLVDALAAGVLAPYGASMGRRSTTWGFALGAVACVATSEVGTQQPSTSTPEPAVLTASCEVDPGNALRAWCAIDTDPPGDVVVRLSPGQDQEQEHRAGLVAAHHDVGVMFMVEDTPYEWVAERIDGAAVPVTGSFRTGALPAYAQEAWTVEGVPPVPFFGHVGVCEGTATAVVTRASDGATVWYEPFPEAERFVGLQWTDDGTFLGLSDPDAVAERDLMGREVLSFLRDDMSGAWHHDLARWGDRTFVITGEEIPDGEHVWRIDGLQVFDADGAYVDAWRLADVWRPLGPHADHGDDVNHSNSVQVRDGVALLSVRHLSSVVALVVDPDAEDFGTIRWRLGGDEAQGWPTDFRILGLDGSPDPFVEQHHATWLDDDRVALFDNGPGGEASRALELTLDREAGEARITRELPMDRHCSFQGGHHVTDDGHAVVVCAPVRNVKVFAPETDEIVWEADGSCLSGPSKALPRMIPMPPSPWAPR
jgi:hypothetical protein